MGLWLSSRGSPGLSEPLCQGRRWAWLSLRGGPALIPTNGHTGPLPWEDEGSPPASPGPGLLALPRFQTGLRWAETRPMRWLRLTQALPPPPRFMTGESFKPPLSFSGHSCSYIGWATLRRVRAIRLALLALSSTPECEPPPAPPASTPGHTEKPRASGSVRTHTHKQAHAHTFLILQTHTYTNHLKPTPSSPRLASGWQGTRRWHAAGAFLCRRPSFHTPPPTPADT